jgi:hypothetical protein
MMMVQFDAALDAFKGRYYQYVGSDQFSRGTQCWITEEQLAAWDTEDAELELEEGEDDL